MPHDIVDSHFHVWELGRFSYPWPNESVAPIFRDIPLAEAGKELASSGVTSAVFVQCLNACPEEAIWVLRSPDCSFVKGVVAGVSLTDHAVLSTQLDQLSRYPRFVGVRHILDMEEDPAWVVRGEVVEGLRMVAARGKTFDFLARPHHLPYVATLARALPELKIVIDHIAKPLLSESLEVAQDWREAMEAAAACPNVYCKISGLVTEVDPATHSTPFDRSTFQSHVDVVLAAFGPARCMVGSDWPVLRLTGANYGRVLGLHRELLSGLSEQDQEMVLGGNAAAFYGLE